MTNCFVLLSTISFLDSFRLEVLTNSATLSCFHWFQWESCHGFQVQQDWDLLPDAKEVLNVAAELNARG